MESCWSRIKAELFENGVFRSLEDAHTELFEYIECYYNLKRRHSSLGNISPEQFEKNYYGTGRPAKFESKLASLTVRQTWTTSGNFWGYVVGRPGKAGEKGRVYTRTGYHTYCFEAIK